MSRLPPTLLLAGLSYFNQFFGLVIGLLQVKVLTRVLTQADYGSWVQLNVTSALITVLAALNLGHGMLRLASAAPAALQHRYFFTSMVTQLLLILVLLALTWPFAAQLIGFIGTAGTPEWLYPLLFAASSLALLLSQLNNFLTVTNRPLQMVKTATLAMFLSGFAIVTAAWIYRTVIATLIGAIGARLVILLMLLCAARIKFSLLRFDWGLLRAQARLGLPLLMVSVANWAVTSSNRYFINGFLGSEAVARFNVANTLPAMIVLVYTLLSSVFFVKVSRMYDERRLDDLSTWMSTAVKFYLLIGIGLAVTIISASRQLIVLVANETYWFDALPLVYTLISIGSLLFGLIQIYSRVFDLEKRPFRSTVNWLVTMIVNISLCWLLIPGLGLVGAACALPAALLSGLLVATAHRPTYIQWRVKWLRTIVFGSFVISAAYLFGSCWAQKLEFLQGLAISIAAGAITVIIGFAIGIIDRRDMSLIMRA